MKKYLTSVAAIVIATQLVAADNKIVPIQQVSMPSKTTIQSKPIDLEQEVIKNEESSVASGRGNKLPLPTLTQKPKIKSYDAIIEMLKTRDSYKVQKNQDDAKVAEEDQKKEIRLQELKAEKKQKDTDRKIDREVQELLLPIPIGSITIGDKIVMFAEYREKRLKDDVLPNQTHVASSESDTAQPEKSAVTQASLFAAQDGLPDLKSLVKSPIDQSSQGKSKAKMSSKSVIELQDSVFESKRIRVKKGDVFNGGWIVKSLNENFIEYSNPAYPNETVKKYN